LCATDEAQAAVVEIVGVKVVDRMLLRARPHVDVDMAVVERSEGPHREIQDFQRFQVIDVQMAADAETTLPALIEA
jgi:hypothetical protein